MPLSRNFTPTCTTHTHTHSLRISPSMRVLPRSPVSFFHSCSSTIVPALNRCAVSPSLKRLASRNNTVRVRLVSHHSPDTFSVSRVPSLAPGVPLLGLSVLTSARHTIPKPAHELTHSLTYLLTYSSSRVFFHGDRCACCTVGVSQAVALASRTTRRRS